jgi:hypothetical protein
MTMSSLLTLTTLLLAAPVALSADPVAPQTVTLPSLIIILGDLSADQTATFSFMPNQLSGNLWYRPGNPPELINGHADNSFGHKELWPTLLENLKQAHGSYSISAAEIGYMSTTAGLLQLLKSEGIPISVELPGFTQCIEGTLLGNAEIKGEAVNGVNIFSKIFGIDNEPDRTNPAGAGWFVTRDGQAFIPDELIFDERIPNLLPDFDPALLAHTAGTWEQRKQAARIVRCAIARQPYQPLLSSLMQDYVDYLNVAKAHWGDAMPAVSLHWNVNPGWEWRDEKGLDDIFARNPAWFDEPDNFWQIVANSPQYNSVQYLEQLVDVLTMAGFNLKTVYMDVDWTYDIPYITEILKRHKTALSTKGVQMGINVVEASIGDQEELYYEANTLKRRSDPLAARNVLYENTLISIMQFLKGSGIYEKGMQIRVGSWSHRPYEIGEQVNENTPGSLAHTANEIFNLLEGI